MKTAFFLIGCFAVLALGAVSLAVITPVGPQAVNPESLSDVVGLLCLGGMIAAGCVFIGWLGKNHS